MAQTYYLTEAFNSINRQFGRNIEDASAAVISNMAINRIWKAFDWKESVAILPPFFLIPDEQDYGPPTYSVPTDFLGLRKCYLVQTSTSPSTRSPLNIIKGPDLTHIRQLPNIIGYDPTAKVIRVYPRVPSNVGATDWLIDGDYKKKPTKVTPTTLQQTKVPWDDLYFENFCEVLRWAAYFVAGDERQDAQMARADYSISKMAECEGLNYGDSISHPSEGLALDGGYGSGLGWGGSFPG